jgi:hypothetical protein
MRSGARLLVGVSIAKLLLTDGQAFADKCSAQVMAVDTAAKYPPAMRWPFLGFQALRALNGELTGSTRR